MSSIHVHSERSARTSALSNAFWSNVDKGGDCWLWTGPVMTRGYGKFSFGGDVELAHRMAYILENGGIPSRMYVDHKCHRRRCVNPDHLRVVTPKQNEENRAGAQVNSTSGVRGVTWDRMNSKWRAKVQHGGKVFTAGRFADLVDAERAVIALRNELFTHNDKDREVAA